MNRESPLEDNRGPRLSRALESQQDNASALQFNVQAGETDGGWTDSVDLKRADIQHTIRDWIEVELSNIYDILFHIAK